MSYPTGDHQAPSPGSGRGQRPSFDRPSLFAGMEDDAVHEDTQRVRILSTLESTRHASRPKRTPGGRRTRPSARRGWLQGLLWGSLGLGVVALMTGFVMVLQDGHEGVAHVHAVTATSTPPQAKVKAVHDAPPTAAGPAVIETAATSPVPAAPSTTTSSSAANAPPAQRNREETGSPAQATATTGTTVATAKPAAAKSAPQAAPTGTNASKNQDEDVALLEAMFAHTGRKPVPATKPAGPKN